MDKVILQTIDSSSTVAQVPERGADQQRSWHSILREKEGSMAIETAIVLPTFFLLLFGIFEMSMLLTGYCNAAYAVRTAARYASVHSSTSLIPAQTTDVQAMVQSNLFMPGAANSNVAVDYTQYNTGRQGNFVGDIVNVGITWSQTIDLPGYRSTLTLSTQTHRVILR